MKTFRSTLALWLASHGMTSEETELVLAHPRMKLTMDTCDSGGALSDLPTVLYSLRSDASSAARHALYDAGEQFLLLQALSHDSRKLRLFPKPTRSTGEPKHQRKYDLTLLATGTDRSFDNDWYVLLGNRRWGLSPVELSQVASASTVRRGIWWIGEHPVFTPEVFEGVVERVFSKLYLTLGLTTTAATELEVCVTERGTATELKTNTLEMLLQMSSSDYLALIDRLGPHLNPVPIAA